MERRLAQETILKLFLKKKLTRMMVTTQYLSKRTFRQSSHLSFENNSHLTEVDYNNYIQKNRKTVIRRQSGKYLLIGHHCIKLLSLEWQN